MSPLYYVVADILNESFEAVALESSSYINPLAFIKTFLVRRSLKYDGGND